jgi:ATP-dependent DNA helicase RecQ
MVHYCRDRGCRRRELLAYFGEPTRTAGCAGCDNCLEPPETFDGTLLAQKFLSSVFRAQQASYSGDASFGINHHADLLTGVANERARKWGHERLSTFGIGKERSRAEWQLIGRELVRLGLLRLAGGEYPTLALSEEGAQALRSRRSIELTRLPDTTGKAVRPEKRRRDGAIDCDEALFEMLRALRREIADARGCPRTWSSATSRCGRWRASTRRPTRICSRCPRRREEAGRLRRALQGRGRRVPEDEPAADFAGRT